MKKIRQLRKTIRIINNHPLSIENIGGYKSKIYKRFIKWQLTKNRYKDGKIIEWINDCKLKLYPSRTSAVGNYYFGLFEYEPMAFLYHYLDSEDIYFDIGANVGVYSVLAKKAKKIVSFEPAEDTFQILLENLKVNNVSNANSVCCGVSDKDGSLTFTKNRDAVNRIVDQTESIDGIETETINVVSLDSFCKENNLFPSVIKIDTEGAEESIIKGAETVIQNESLNVIVAEIFSDNKISTMLSEYGFKLYIYNPRKRELISGTANQAGNNGIYIRNVDEALSRVKKSDSIVYAGSVLC